MTFSKAIYRILLAAVLTYAPASLFGAELLLRHSPQPLQAEGSMEAFESWETPVEGFFIRTHNDPPIAMKKPDSWILKIDGLVEKPFEITLGELKKMTQKTLHAVLECSGNGRGLQSPTVPGVQWQRGAVGNAEWTGVSLATVLALAHVKPEARFVTIKGADNPTLTSVPPFVRSIPLTKARGEKSLLAWHMNRIPMAPLHGGPLRVILPDWYGENWIKWVTTLTLTEDEDMRFFMKKGYRVPKTAVKPGEAWDSSTGTPIEELRVQSFIVSPVQGQSVSGAQVSVKGKAFSGAGTIARVELSTDSGTTWQTAELEAAHPSGGWQEFHGIAFAPASKQALTILARATDALGNTQPLEHTWNPGGYVRNAVASVTINLGRVALPLGSQIVANKCQTCHAPELLESQRLTPKQWESVLAKMQSFGVSLSPEERLAVLATLSVYTSDGPRKEPRMIAYGREVDSIFDFDPPPPGNAKRGAQHFALYCAACHGIQGEGTLAPRLAGRNVPLKEFWLTVLDGRHLMPPFVSVLKRQGVADLEVYLHRGADE